MKFGTMSRVLALGAVVLAMAGTILHMQSPDALALTNCSTSTMAIDGAEQQIANAINQQRADHGLPALKVSSNLSRAAAWKSEDQAAQGGLSHTDSAGRSPFQRAVDCGYASANVSEIVAAGFGPSAVVPAWMGSPGHRSAILTPNAKVMGVGVAGGHSTVKFGFVDDSGEPVVEVPTASPTFAPAPTAIPTQAPQVAGVVRGVSSGVNLVAYEGFPVTPAEAFRSLGTSLQWVYAWDPVGQAWLRYAPGAPDYVNTLRFVVPGTAYYISLTGAATWSY